jgi:hypothetical protein
MKIGLVIPIYLKGNPIHRPYEIVLKNYSKMNILIHICGSEGEISRKFAEPFLSDNVKYFEVPQSSFCFSSSGDDFIRKKFNDSLKTLPINCDWYCLSGADDLVDPLFFERLSKLDPFKRIMAGVGMENPLYLLDEKDYFKAYSIKLQYANKYKLLAGINCFSKAYINKIKCNPYALNGCETGAELLCTKHDGEVIGLEGSIIMFKGNGVLNPLDKCLKVHENVKINESELDYIATTLI